jgi:hypothetical protein
MCGYQYVTPIMVKNINISILKCQKEIFIDFIDQQFAIYLFPIKTKLIIVLGQNTDSDLRIKNIFTRIPVSFYDWWSGDSVRP